MKRLIIARSLESIYVNLKNKDRILYVCTDTHNIYFTINLIFQEDEFKFLTLNETSITITAYGPGGTSNLTIEDYSDGTIDLVIQSIQTLISKSYKPAGDLSSSEIVSGLLIPSNFGNVYDITESFEIGDDPGQISSSLFVENTNGNYQRGTRIVVVNAGTTEDPVYKFDIFSSNGSGGGGTGVKPDWDAGPGSPAEILNKPTALSDFSNDMGFTDNIGTITGITMNGNDMGTSGVVDLGYLQSEITEQNKLSADLITDGTNNKVFTAEEKTKLSGIAADAEANVQSDWEELDSNSDAFIKNKPTIPDDFNWEEF